MPLTTPDPVMARLDRLERESRRWRRVALGSWLAIAALLLLGQSPPRAPRPASPARTVEAERFVLRDARGRAGAMLGWEADDTPRLVLHDPTGQPRTVLAIGAGGAPGLTLLDADGKTVRAALVVGPDGAPGLALFDPAGKPRLAAALFHASGSARATSGREPAPAIVAYDAAGVVRATFGLRGADATAGLELADGRGAARAVLRVRPDGAPDLTFVRQVAEAIAHHINGYKVVVTKSTVPTGTGRMIEQILRSNDGDREFSVVSNPEFLREGSAIADFLRPDRIVIGASDARAIEVMKEVYGPLFLAETPFVITDVASAELIKYASNGFLAVKISFINEIARLCELMGADVHDVSRGMGLDGRIGSRFLLAGPGFGGSCFPKDTAAAVDLARQHGYRFRIIESAICVNAETKARMIEKIAAAAGPLAGRTVGVLGLSFKPETDDIRESPALAVISDLVAAGASVRAFDPAAMENARAIFPDLHYATDAYDCATGADVLVLTTEWNEFRALDFGRLAKLMRSKTVVDLRNVYDPRELRAAGWSYTGVGRS